MARFRNCFVRPSLVMPAVIIFIFIVMEFSFTHNAYAITKSLLESSPDLLSLQPDGSKTILRPKTLLRRFDTVVVPGDLLSTLIGKEIAQLRLYAYSAGKFEPIVYQIDERDALGEYVFTGGKMAGEDVDKGKFDENDELIFVCRHAGDQVNQELWPQESSAGQEIVITNPQDPTRQAWVYLFYFSNNPPPGKTEDYLAYDPALDRVTGKYYTVGYNKGYMLFADLLYPKASGGNGKDFLDRVKLHVDVQLLKGLIHIRKRENDILCDVVGWIDGPVRVIRNTQNYFRILFNIPSPSLYAVTEYYPNYFTVPMRFSIPFNLKWVMNHFVVSGFTLTVLGDFHSEMAGSQVLTSRNPEGFPLTGNTPEEVLRRKYQLSKIDWGSFSKKGVGGWCVRMAFLDCLLQYFNIHIVDDLSRKNPPEDEPGEIGGGIFVYSDTLRKKYDKTPGFNGFTTGVYDILHKGTFELYLDTYIITPEPTIEDTKEWMAVRDYPLLVDVSGKEGPAALMVGETDPALIKSVITDRRGRQLNLRDLAFHVGSSRTTGWDAVIGYQIEEDKWYKIPIAEIKQMDFRIEDEDPTFGLSTPLYIKVTKKDGSIIDLFNAKTAGFGGHTGQDKTFFIWNPLIERIELRD